MNKWTWTKVCKGIYIYKYPNDILLHRIKVWKRGNW
jgi:hypothetical protein